MLAVVGDQVVIPFSQPQVCPAQGFFPAVQMVAGNIAARLKPASGIYGDGIKMYLLSQGSWVKVLAPQEFVDEMQAEIEKMRRLYK